MSNALVLQCSLPLSQLFMASLGAQRSAFAGSLPGTSSDAGLEDFSLCKNAGAKLSSAKQFDV